MNPRMIDARNATAAALVLLGGIYALWFAHDAHVAAALIVFALPPMLLAWAVWRRKVHASFWAGVLALFWFAHAVMVLWTRPPERVFACIAMLLALAIVSCASIPGLLARRTKRRESTSL